MKAIPTRYNGYHFRSRLEARWAVFFDALGLSWEYEPEGFDLGDGVRYLPDFWLPSHGVWVEVKAGQLSEDERNKVVMLLLHSRRPVFVTRGLPDKVGEVFYSYTQIGGEWNCRGGDGYAEFDQAAAGRFMQMIVLNGLPNFDRNDHDDDPEYKEVLIGITDAKVARYSAAYMRAVDAAKSARFEFGQKGAL